MKYLTIRVLFILSCLFIAMYSYNYSKIKKVIAVSPAVQTFNVTKATNTTKFILKWPHNGITVGFVYQYMGEGRQGFIDQGCPYNNCYVTGDKNFLEDYTQFDLILFDGFPPSYQWPAKRLPHQKYAFGSYESADNFPICDKTLNDFFNWTFTYKIDSDVRWLYVLIRDKEGNVIGPNKDMNWIKLEDMKPVSKELKDKLRKKSKAAAWFVSNCKTRNRRGEYVELLQDELKKYNLTVDVYGKCGPLKCPPSQNDLCHKEVENDYYFYLSFENSFAEDYVTEKLLTALLNNAIPIVYGGANYTRFLPEATYLDARELGAKNLAKIMYDLIQNPETYFNYFRWHNHYVYDYYDRTGDENGYCGVCTILNNYELFNKKSSYKNFKKWWNPLWRCKNKPLLY